MRIIDSDSLQEIIDKIERNCKINNGLSAQMFCIDYFNFNKWNNYNYFKNCALFPVKSFTASQKKCIKQLLDKDIKLIDYSLANVKYFQKDAFDNFISHSDTNNLAKCYNESKRVEKRIIRKLDLKNNFASKVRRTCHGFIDKIKFIIYEINKNEYENIDTIDFNFKQNSSLSFNEEELFVLYCVARKNQFELINGYQEFDAKIDPYNISSNLELQK